MKPPRLNLYGDEKRLLSPGFGVDIQSQRLDLLDQAALKHLEQLIVDGCYAPRCLDLGCGQGSFGALLAQQGADCVAIDHLPLEKRAHLASKSLGRLQHIEGDLLDLNATLSALGDQKGFHIAVCQRVIHYFPWHQALDLLNQLHRWMHPQGKLYLGVSGLASELGQNYAGTLINVEQRFSPLSPLMRELHGIQAPVCLYRPEELEQLLKTAKLRCESLHTSSFGNLKATASPIPAD